MEQNISISPKRISKIARVLLFLIRKSLSKTKIMLDAKYFMLKRGQIVVKVVNHLMFLRHHHQQQNHLSAVSKDGPYTGHLPCSTVPKEYVYSCSNTPYHHLRKVKRNRHMDCYAYVDSGDENLDEVKRVLDMMLVGTDHKNDLVEELSSRSIKSTFGRSSVVRELCLMDSPFLLRNAEVDNHVDEAAEEFIKKFYSQLREQDC